MQTRPKDIDFGAIVVIVVFFSLLYSGWSLQLLFAWMGKHWVSCFGTACRIAVCFFFVINVITLCFSLRHTKKTLNFQCNNVLKAIIVLNIHIHCLFSNIQLIDVWIFNAYFCLSMLSFVCLICFLFLFFLIFVRNRRKKTENYLLKPDRTAKCILFNN